MKKISKTIVSLSVIFCLVFPLNNIKAQDPVIDELVNASIVSGTSISMSEMGEILGILYNLSTPGSSLTQNIYMETIEFMEDTFGIDKDLIRRQARKTYAPTVEIFFDQISPKEGEKVTAFAVPQMFRNNKENLYYTWYIIHTDANGNPTNSIEAGKREAMGRIARGSFDPELFGIEYGSVSTDDGDGFEANYGGVDGVGGKSSSCEGGCEECDCLERYESSSNSCDLCYDDEGTPVEYYEEYDKRIANTRAISRCYMRNFGLKFNSDLRYDEFSGRDLIVDCSDQRQFATCGNSDYITGDGGFDVGEEECWQTHPGKADTDGDGIQDEADVAGLGQSQFTWNYREGDRVGVVIEGTSTIPINEGTTARDVYGRASDYSTSYDSCQDAKIDCLADNAAESDPATRLADDYSCNSTFDDCMKTLWEYGQDDPLEATGQMTGYYKIMWATPDICDDNAKEDDVDVDGDWCEENDDVGFPYLVTVPVEEEGEQFFDVDIEFTPKEPQFHTVDEDYSDLIIANAVVSDREVNSDFLYYRWSVMRCQPGDFEDCTDVSDTVEFDSYREGIGAKMIGFRPTAAIFEGDSTKAMLKLVVLVSKHRSDVMQSPNPGVTLEDDVISVLIDRGTMAEQIIPLTLNNIEIFLHYGRAHPPGGVSFDSWDFSDEVCENGLYWNVCPVYPYQVIVALAELDDDVESFAWALNGQKFQPPKLTPEVCNRIFGGHAQYICQGQESSEDFGYAVYFPVMGTDRELLTLSVIAERVNDDPNIKDDELVSERLLSVNYPLVSLSFGNNVRAAQNQKGVLDEFYVAPAGQDIDVTANIVPSYLEESGEDEGLSIDWYWNEDVLVKRHNERTVRIQLPNQVAKISTLRVRLKKNFSEAHVKGLGETWKMYDAHTLVKDTVIKIKTTGFVSPEAASIKAFFASTVKNSPYYLLFIIKTALSIVLVWMIIFGLTYKIGLSNSESQRIKELRREE